MLPEMYYTLAFLPCYHLGLILFFLHESTDCEERGDLDETVILLGLLLLLG